MATFRKALHRGRTDPSLRSTLKNDAKGLKIRYITEHRAGKPVHHSNLSVLKMHAVRRPVRINLR